MKSVRPGDQSVTETLGDEHRLCLVLRGHQGNFISICIFCLVSVLMETCQVDETAAYICLPFMYDSQSILIHMTSFAFDGVCGYSKNNI